MTKMPIKKSDRREKTGPKQVLGKDRKDLIMVRSAVDPDVRFFLASELADDQAIADGVMGKMIQACVYEFKQDGKPIRGLTVQGVREASRLINLNPKSGMRIALEDKLFIKHDVEMNGQKGVVVEALAVDHISGMRNWGVKFESYKKKGRNGPYDDTFVVEKAVSKAQRNAISGLIPLQLKMQIIQKFADQGSVAHLPPPPPQTTRVLDAPPKPTEPKKLPDIIKTAIETTNDPEQLQDIAEKCEQSPKLNQAAKTMLSVMAKDKANRIIEQRNQDHAESDSQA